MYTVFRRAPTNGRRQFPQGYRGLHGIDLVQKNEPLQTVPALVASLDGHSYRCGLKYRRHVGQWESLQNRRNNRGQCTIVPIDKMQLETQDREWTRCV